MDIPIVIARALGTYRTAFVRESVPVASFNGCAADFNRRIVRRQCRHRQKAQCHAEAQHHT
ncbi:hypothetical protein SDC9_60528 [bioreactor metagenome]|uniref:Uncharacterized protein n=1 Tax=bioreactor metagenome TaxID=1076179 RepID=A0A644XEH2_9ZZZZ